MKDVVIVNGCRTAIGAYGGTLKTTRVVDLGAVALKGTLQKAGLRPVASEQCIKFAADSIRDAGKLALEQKNP